MCSGPPRSLTKALVVAAWVAMAGCVGPTAPPSADKLAGTDYAPAWPPPPAQARIKLVRNIGGAEDLGIEPSNWRRVVDWLVGNDPVSLVRPTSVVSSSNGTIYVADPGIQAIHRFDTQRARHDLIRRSGGLPLSSPIGLSLGGDDRLYITDSALRKIYVLDRNADAAVPMHTSRELQQPTGIAVDQDGHQMFVVDTARHEVLTFDLRGRLLFKFGGPGSNSGRFNFPTFIWHDAKRNRIWVTDSLNFRIQEFDEKGRFVSSFGQLGDATGSLSRPKGVATDSEGQVYVVDAMFHSLQIFDPAGQFLLHVGDQGSRPGQFWLPTGLFIDRRNHIFVADSFNKRVQEFRYLAD